MTHPIQSWSPTTAVLFAALFTCVGTPVSGAELVLDFRGGKAERKLYRFDTKEALESITPEPEGLRWRYVPGKSPNKTLGIAWNYQVRGDFTATARYEILAIEKPARGTGVGVELYLMVHDPVKGPGERDGIPMARLLKSSGAAEISIQKRTTNEEGKRITKNYKFTPTTEATDRGRLRIARVGPTLIASFAEGDAEEFQELQRFEIGTNDISLVRFAGMSGGDPNASMDMRLLEFRLQADEFGKNGAYTAQPPEAAPAKAAAAKSGDAPAPAPTETATPGGDHRWLLWGAILGGIVVAVGVLAFWLRRSKPSEAASAPASADSSADAGPQMLDLVCPGCARRLKVKSTLAGKRVKCPHCGATVPVIGAKTD